MVKIRLKQMLSKRGEKGSLGDELQALIPGIAIQDADGKFLLGSQESKSGKRYAIQLEDIVIGWLTGDDSLEIAEGLLNRLIAEEASNAQLMDEMLDLYREINLLYKLSEKLAVTLDPDAVMSILLEEARRTIKASSGAIFLLADTMDSISRCELFGNELSCESTNLPGDGLIWHLFHAAKGEMVNEVTLDPRYKPIEGSFHSLISAPLKINHKLIGILLLVSSMPTIYTAADLKLLTALVSQAVPSIENAITHERTLRDAQEREAQLQRRIDELRIELDEARQVQKVAELVETEYFQDLRKQSSQLRKIMEGDV